MIDFIKDMELGEMWRNGYLHLSDDRNENVLGLSQESSGNMYQNLNVYALVC